MKSSLTKTYKLLKLGQKLLAATYDLAPTNVILT